MKRRLRASLLRSFSFSASNSGPFVRVEYSNAETVAVFRKYIEDTWILNTRITSLSKIKYFILESIYQIFLHSKLQFISR